MKRILSVLLCLCMVLTMLPATVLAAENADLASYYSTNKAGTGGKKTITVDGDISDWDSSMLIAQGTANDDPRVYRPNSMYENPIDLYALYGAYDNENLYLMWEMTNVQDVVAPNDTYPLSQGVLYQTMNLPLFIAIDTRDSATAIGNNGGLPTGGTFWDSGITFGRSFNKLIATSTNGANGPFLYGGDSTGLNPVEELSYKEVGMTFKYGLGILSKNVYGIDKAYGEYNNRVVGDMCNEDAAWVDFNTMGHSSSTMDFHYEISIPLSSLGTTATEVAQNGLGVMLVMTSGKSGMDCLPYDLSMNDLADLDDAAGSQENNSFEKSDEDHITAKFAQVGGTVVNDDNDETQPTVTQPIVTDPIVTDPVVTDPIVTEPVVTEPIVAPSNTIYLKTTSDWEVDGARFAAYFWDGNGNETWADATDSDGDGYYEVVLPGDSMKNVIFVRMNGSTTANNWDNKWNQTQDLTIPTDGKNCFVLDAGWNGTGSWTTYTPSGYECPHTSHNTSGNCTACGAAVSHTYVSGTCSVCGGKDPNYVTPSDPTDPTTPTTPTTPTDPIEPTVPSNIQDGVTLHCWNWSYKNIEANMAKIASQGYTAVQTSPIQQAKEATVGNGMKSHWWVYYQPMGFHIDQTSGNAMGTKDDFISMCNTAHKYGVKVIVDVVANHLGNQTANNLASTIIDDLKNDSSCWHDISKDTTNYNDRYDITQHCMAGLPDLNTANKKVQNYALGFLKECIDAGADGFRFDGAKHIETPEDSSSGCGSDFWPYVINGATEYAKTSRGLDLYCYGEILDQPGGSLSITAYTKYMSVTDNSWGNTVRGSVNGGNAGGYASSYHKGAPASKLVIWNESHDTYANEGSGNVSTQNINKTWALVAARADAMGLYFARPSNYASQKLGEGSVTGWANPEVKAVNDFHNFFVGQTEYLANQNGIAYCERGTQGVVLVNCNGGSTSVSVTANKMAAGTYIDTITGNTFTVSNGKISGNIGSTGIAVVYSGEEPCKHPTHDINGICPECNGTVSHTYSNGFCTVCGAERPQLTGEFYLFGWINGANYACEEDAANLGQYKLVNGTLTTTFNEDSYVGVKSSDNFNYYMTNGFQGMNVNSVVLYNTQTLGTTADKMHVPGGMKVTFTLVDNGDGSYTLSYADATAHTHSYTATVTTPAGCETEGVKTYKCSCGDSYTEAIPAIKHNYSSTVTTPAGCDTKGVRTYTCANCSNTYTEEIPVNGHAYVDGTCTVCGGKDPNYVEPVVTPTITLEYPSLSFESEVFYNVYFTATNTADVVEMGLLTWNTRPEDSASATVNTADSVIPGYVHNADADLYMVRSEGVPAKKLGDNLYMRVYAKLTDGTYAYSSVTYYSAKFYAASIFGSSTNENMKALCVAMLNYGAAAQVHFNYKTDDLMNSVLSDSQKALVKEYSEDMIGSVIAADSNKVGTFKSNGGFSNGYPSVSFEAAFSINYYLIPKNAVDGDITLYCWDLETYNSVSTLTEANATSKVVMTEGSNLFVGAYEGIAAKQIDETVFVAGVYTSNGTRYSSPVISYSLGAYCAEQIANGSETMQEFAKATAVYGNYAKTYFASLNG